MKFVACWCLIIGCYFCALYSDEWPWQAMLWNLLLLMFTSDHAKDKWKNNRNDPQNLTWSLKLPPSSCRRWRDSCRRPWHAILRNLLLLMFCEWVEAVGEGPIYLFCVKDLPNVTTTSVYQCHHMKLVAADVLQLWTSGSSWGRSDLFMFCEKTFLM